MVGGFVPSNINQELFFKYVKTSHFPCQFLYYLENTTHFNLLSPQTCAFGLKFQRSLLDISSTIMNLRVLLQHGMSTLMIRG